MKKRRLRPFFQQGPGPAIPSSESEGDTGGHTGQSRCYDDYASHLARPLHKAPQILANQKFGKGSISQWKSHPQLFRRLLAEGQIGVKPIDVDVVSASTPWTPTLIPASNDVDANFSDLHALQSQKFRRQGNSAIGELSPNGACWIIEEGFPDLDLLWRLLRNPE
ncbi:hypothetical protein Taro_056813 [Colocasia esculenta]|uniref:Uncharacterized protein n=1 Tax=Colocasia esculenta TaxID=4460 RepID=A0A843XYJ3_COLES|nr:hypothetical protein [Colocasia esculenta]